MLCASALAGVFTAEVIKVSDGDTLWVKNNNGNKIKIRLYGIDCPELAQPYGKNAAAFAAKTVLHKNVLVQNMDKDQYGRMVAIISPPNGKASLNELLVQNGYAWYYGMHCKTTGFCKKLRQLEKSARNQQLGLWQALNPVPPWDYRKKAAYDTDDAEDYAWFHKQVKALGQWLKNVLKTAQQFYFN